MRVVAVAFWLSSQACHLPFLFTLCNWGVGWGRESKCNIISVLERPLDFYFPTMCFESMEKNLNGLQGLFCLLDACGFSLIKMRACRKDSTIGFLHEKAMLKI